MEIMSDNSIRIFSEKYENDKTGENVDGVTVMIDGKFKQMLDIIIQKEGRYASYPEVIRDILFSGINNFIGRYK
jgi:hypothetical protein